VIAKFFCLDCKSILCTVCFTQLHSAHKCSDINAVDDGFRKQMESDEKNLAAGVERCKKMLLSLDTKKCDLSKQVADAKAAVGVKAKQVKHTIDVHELKLMNELSSVQQHKLNAIDRFREEIQRQLSSLESHRKSATDVRQKGTTCVVRRLASNLHSRAEELLMSDVVERTLVDLENAQVTFASSDFAIDDVNKTLGQLSLNKEGELIAYLGCQTFRILTFS